MWYVREDEGESLLELHMAFKDHVTSRSKRSAFVTGRLSLPSVTNALRPTALAAESRLFDVLQKPSGIPT